MLKLDFLTLYRRRAEKMRALAGPYLERLTEGRSVNDWLAEVEVEDAAVAQAIRDEIRQREMAQEIADRERNDYIAEITEALEAPRWPEVDLEMPQGGKRFDNFEARPEYPAVRQALEAVRRWVAGAEGAPLLTLAGVPGTGKTHLAEAATAALAEARRECIYRSESDLIGEAMGRMERKTTEALLEAVCGVGWLVLDDLGVAALSDWGRGVMDRVINARYELAQAGAGYTLITTNLTDKDLSPRVRRRLQEPGVGRVLELKAQAFFALKGR